jgi:hypothetical protein
MERTGGFDSSRSGKCAHLQEERVGQVIYVGYMLIAGLTAQPAGPIVASDPSAPASLQAPATPGSAPGQPSGSALPGVPGAPLASRVTEPVHPAKSRYLVQVMEGVLQSAVRYAAGQMNLKLQAVSPELLQLSGAARARGFRLDGYGVFFDVEVPAALRQTMGWTAKMMQQNDQSLDQAIVQLRRLMNELDGKRRMDAETALRLVELRAKPALPRGNPYGMGDRIAANAVQASSAAGDAANAQTVASNAAGNGNNVPQPQGQAPSPSVQDQVRAQDLAWMQNPDAAYEVEVREALVSAMLEYGSTLALQSEEWLTVAARDNQSVVIPGDLSETVTVILRIKGSDLAELMAGRLTPQDARRRVEVREF